MPNVWFTADFHFGHTNIIRYCGRPFADAKGMDGEILDRLNSAVADKDLLYFLGDFCRSGKDALAYRQKIRCKNVFFVEGNHDADTKRISPEFRWWKQLAERDDRQQEQARSRPRFHGEKRGRRQGCRKKCQVMYPLPTSVSRAAL